MPSVTSPASRAASIIPLSNVEAQWATLSTEEKATVHEQREVLQKKEWKELSLDEKRAGTCLKTYCTRIRAPTSKPGNGLKILGYTMALVGVAGVLGFAIREFGSADFAV